MAATWRSPVGCTVEGSVPCSAFKTWCRKHKIKWNSCDVRQTPTTGRAVIAAADIREGAVVVEVPDDAVLMGENCTIADALAEYGLLKRAEDVILEVLGLILAVMYERSLGNKSKWAGYLSFLPEDMTHVPLYWEPQERRELQGTAAADKLEGRVQLPGDAPTRVAELFDEVVLPFCGHHPDITRTMMAWTQQQQQQQQQHKDKKQEQEQAADGNQPPSEQQQQEEAQQQQAGKRRRQGKPPTAAAAAAPAAKRRRRQQQGEQEEEQELTEEAARAGLWPLYCWATAAVASYSFKLGDDMFEAMVPVWDALNHVTDRVNVRLHHDEARGVLQMIATEDIPKGAEVVNCYGQLSSAELLRGYGFVEQQNSKEHAQVPAHFLLRAVAAAAPASAATSHPSAAGAGSGGGSAAAQAEFRAEAEEQDGLQLFSDSDSDDELPELDFEDDLLESRSAAAAAKGADAGAAAGDNNSSGEPTTSTSASSSCPPLQEAMGKLGARWQEAWLLAHYLQLLPANGVYTVDSKGSPAPQLLAVLQLLLLDAAAMQELYGVVRQHVATATASATAAAADNAVASSEPTAAPPAAPAAAAAAAPGGSTDSTLQPPAAAVRCSPSLMAAGLQQLAGLMLSRYTCSLQEDEVLLQQLEQLAPRLQAAVVARAAEKRCWAALQERLRSPAAVKEMAQQSAAAVQQGLQSLGARRAAAAVKRQQQQLKRQKRKAGAPGKETDELQLSDDQEMEDGGDDSSMDEEGSLGSGSEDSGPEESEGDEGVVTSSDDEQGAGAAAAGKASQQPATRARGRGSGKSSRQLQQPPKGNGAAGSVKGQRAGGSSVKRHAGGDVGKEQGRAPAKEAKQQRGSRRGPKTEEIQPKLQQPGAGGFQFNFAL